MIFSSFLQKQPNLGEKITVVYTVKKLLPRDFTVENYFLPRDFLVTKKLMPRDFPDENK